MSLGTILIVIFTGILLLFLTLVLLKQGKIPVKFSLLWIMVALVLLLVGFVPNIIVTIATKLGFKPMSNMLLGILMIMLFFMCMALTVIVSGQKIRITLLTQELSILKQKVEKKDNENG